MSFSSQIKEELVRLKLKDREQRLSQLCALTLSCGSLRLGRPRSLLYRSESPELSKHICALSGSLSSLEALVEKQEQQHRRLPLYKVRLQGEGLMALMEELCLLQQQEDGVMLLRTIPLHFKQKPECARAFLRGVFLGCGSCTDPKGEYHLELVCPTEELSKDMCQLLSSFDLSCGVTLRRNRYVLYVKNGDDITGFLALVGANVGAMTLENIRAEKETRNYVNRTVNCESANLDKLANASARQQKAVHYIIRRKRFTQLPGVLREAAELRLEYPDASLQELADLAGIQKSGMNHRLKRLVDYAEDLERGLQT